MTRIQSLCETCKRITCNPLKMLKIRDIFIPTSESCSNKIDLQNHILDLVAWCSDHLPQYKDLNIAEVYRNKTRQENIITSMRKMFTTD